MDTSWQTICPVCGEIEFGYVNDFDTCPVCGWVNDISQIYDPEETGANAMTLSEYKAMWDAKQK